MKWVLGIAGLLVLGLVFHLNLLVYAMYVLGGVLLLGRLLAHAWTENLVAGRTALEPVCEIGDSLRVTVEVENRGRLSVPWILLEDSIPNTAGQSGRPRLEVDGARIALTRLAAGESETVFEYDVKFLQRGYFQFGPLLVETGDVFGLHRRYRLLTEPQFVLVLPKVLPLQGYNLASRRPMGEIRVAHRLFEDPTRLAGVRLFQQGDPLNRVHWRATARTGQLHSRVYENSRVAGATVLLDFHEESYRGPAGPNSSELAILAAAALANAVSLQGQQIGLVTNGRDAADRIREEGWQGEFLERKLARQQAAVAVENTRMRPVVVPTRRSSDNFLRILETLARLEQTDGMDFSSLVVEASVRIPQDATVVAVLSRVTPELAQSLGQLVQRGLLVTAVVVISGGDVLPDWAKPPEWAEILLAQNINFHMVNSEEAVMNLCAQAIIR
ncbi:MAG TPA: DUF58 domain-containing protein [Verrucomicrobiae bacterium]|jgi:uncharacterized protein (DUF58 family)